MVKRIQVTFSRREYYLYEWLINYARKTVKGKRWGISEVVKEALKLYMIAKTATKLDVFDLYFRELFIGEFLECEDCGSRMKIENYRREGDVLVFELYCPGCNMLDRKRLDLSKFKTMEDIAKQMIEEIAETEEEEERKPWRIKV